MQERLLTMFLINDLRKDYINSYMNLNNEYSYGVKSWEAFLLEQMTWLDVEASKWQEINKKGSEV